jgi:hypothetical protein
MVREPPKDHGQPCLGGRDADRNGHVHRRFTQIGTATLDNSGTATFTTAPLTAGNHVTATV